MKFHRDGSKPEDGEIFVFGSNLAGIHGAGAAYAALGYYGAKMYKGTGLSGQSFAIPTKDERIVTLPLGIIEEYVNEFHIYVKSNPNMEFFITRVGCGLAGYSDEQIAPMFKDFPDNCSFSVEWKEYL